MSGRKYTEGVCQDGAAILENGKQITITEILDNLNRIETIIVAKNDGIQELLDIIDNLEAKNKQLKNRIEECEAHVESISNYGESEY